MLKVKHKAWPVKEGVELIVDIRKIQIDKLDTHSFIPNTRTRNLLVSKNVSRGLWSGCILGNCLV